MANTQHNVAETMVTGEDREPTAAEIDAWRREDLFLSAEQFSPEEHPRMTNLSAGLMFRGMVRPLEPVPAEYVTMRIPGHHSSKWVVAVAHWNLLWEAAQYRRRMLDEDELPRSLARIADLGDYNITLVPRT